jgi:hypothetical protein
LATKKELLALFLSGSVEFARFIKGLKHGQRFLYHLKLVANSWFVFDKVDVERQKLSNNPLQMEINVASGQIS